MKEDGGNVSAFICESLLGCGGQIILPENYFLVFTEANADFLMEALDEILDEDGAKD